MCAQQTNRLSAVLLVVQEGGDAHSKDSPCLNVCLTDTRLLFFSLAHFHGLGVRADTLSLLL